MTAPVAATPPSLALSPTTPQGPVRPLRDEFKSLPGSTPNRVRELAWRLAHRLGDACSIGFYVMVLTLVSTGAVPWTGYSRRTSRGRNRWAR